MQPIKLHRMFRAWGFEGDPSLIGLWPRLKSRDPVARALLVRWALGLIVFMPIATVLIASALELLGLSIRWFGVAAGLAGGLAVGLVFGTVLSLAFGVAGGVACGVVGGVACGIMAEIAGGVAFGMGVAAFVALGVAVPVAEGVAVPLGGMVVGVAFGVVMGVIFAVEDVLFGVQIGVARGVRFGMVIGVAGSVAEGVAIFRLPLWPVEAFMTLLMVWLIRLRPSAAQSISYWLPFRHHDLIYLPLPGMRALLLLLAGVDVNLCKDMIAEAAASTGQKRAARFALIELQARDLERAAAGRLFGRAADLDFPFLPGAAFLEDDRSLFPILAFQLCAKDLVAGGTNQRQRRLALECARKTIESFRTKTTLDPHPDRLSRRLLPTAALWLDVIREEEHKLALEEAEHPEVPGAFIAGPPLAADRPENRSLFNVDFAPVPSGQRQPRSPVLA
jgi:hypothetical protein